MERLTEWVGDGTDRKAIARQDRRDIGDKDCVARLAAYEDTGLEPEEIADLKDGICMGCSVPAIVAEQRHIQDLLDAENDGRLVVLPCKVGDILYEVDLPEYGVITCKAVSISYYNGPMFHVPGNEAVKSLTVEVEVIDGHGKGSSYNFEIEDFGKHVFLTREAAETALREAAELGVLNAKNYCPNCGAKMDGEVEA